MQTVKSPNVVKCMGRFVGKEAQKGKCVEGDDSSEEGYLYIVMEYCDGGDLEDLFKEHVKSKEYFDEKVIKDFAQQILAALCELCQEQMIHRDIKPGNILITGASPELVLKLVVVHFLDRLHP